MMLYQCGGIYHDDVSMTLVAVLILMLNQLSGGTGGPDVVMMIESCCWSW